MSDEALKLENQLCFPLYAASKAVIHLYKPLLEPLDLTYTQYITMMVLWEHHSLKVREVGTCLHLDSSTLTPLLKRLEQKGLLTRTRSKQDERDLIVTLTEKGEALKEQAAKIPGQLSSCLPIEPDKAQQLYKLLYELMEKLDN